MLYIGYVFGTTQRPFFDFFTDFFDRSFSSYDNLHNRMRTTIITATARRPKYASAESKFLRQLENIIEKSSPSCKAKTRKKV